uniref:Tumor protein D52 n=1 Tax=Otolemur garnettii TaxID=30611 RepID=H0XJT8_OTOGA
EMDLHEDYLSLFDFYTGVNKRYLYLSPSGHSSPPGSPPKFGLLRTVPASEKGEDVAATISTTDTPAEEETLSQALGAEEKHPAEIKTRTKQNIAKGWQDVAATFAYKKTSKTLSQAGQVSAAFSSVGSVIITKLEDVKNSPTFRSFEEKVENLKSKQG